MSVLKNKRKIARTEYENTFSKLYQYSMTQTIKVPKRRKKWLCPNIDNTMNEVYRSLMAVTDSYFSTKTEKYKYASAKATNCIKKLNSLEKPLMILWNVQKYETKKMQTWSDQIKMEVGLLNNMIESENIECTVSILDNYSINKALFLKNMSALHRYTHGKVTNATNLYDDTEGFILISLVDDAFYELMLANKKIPETKEEYEQRKQHISNAITYLKNMNRPMLFYFNLMQYSERVMVEWAKMLSEELKMLYSVQKSDRERFGKLE